MAPQLKETERPEVRIVPTSKRIRARVGGLYVADSRRARLLYNAHHPVTYAFPADDLRPDAVGDVGRPRRDKVFGTVRDAALSVEGRTVERAVRFYDEGPAAGHASIRWDAADAWYEEDEEVRIHPRDPYSRIDILRSSRRVRAELDGQTIAESDRPTLLFETGLPVRYYLPQTDFRPEFLRPSDTQTACPYKGYAAYRSVEIDGTTHRDVVWIYDAPFPEAQKIQGLFGIFNERVDLYLDDELQERPDTPLRDA